MSGILAQRCKDFEHSCLLFVSKSAPDVKNNHFAV